MIEKLLSEKEAAEILGISPNTLKAWRSRPTANSVPYVKIGGRVKYAESALKRHIERNTRR